MGYRRQTALPLLAAGALLAVACSGSDELSLRLTVTFDALSIDQLSMELAAANEHMPAVHLPELPAAAPLSSGFKAVLTLPASWDGKQVDVAVSALLKGAVVARGRGALKVKRGQANDLKVALCADACIVGAAQCNSDGVQSCARDPQSGCAGWQAPQPCPADRPLCSEGQCIASCSPACGPGEICHEDACVASCGGEPCSCQPGETKPCPDTGECSGGTRSCEDGLFGACEWTVGPTPEICDGKDDDCNGKADDTPACGGDTAKWQQETSPVDQKIHAVHGTAGNNVWLVTPGVTLHYDGQAVKTQDAAGGQELWAVSPTDVWSGSGGTLRHYDGAGWQNFATQNMIVLGFWGSSASDIWAVGTSIAIPFKAGFLHYDGDSWKLTEQDGIAEAISGSSASHVWAVGGNGMGGGDTPSWRLEGSDWTAVPTGSQLSLHGVWAVAEGDVWAVGKQQILHHDGQSWTPATPPSLGKGWLVDIWGSSATSLWAVGYADRDEAAGTFGHGIVYHYDGKSWTEVVAPGVIDDKTPALFGVWGANPDDVWVVGDSGTILRLK